LQSFIKTLQKIQNTAETLLPVPVNLTKLECLLTQRTFMLCVESMLYAKSACAYATQKKIELFALKHSVKNK
jgi:hypothetical protein